MHDCAFGPRHTNPGTHDSMPHRFLARYLRRILVGHHHTCDIRSPNLNLSQACYPSFRAFPVRTHSHQMRSELPYTVANVRDTTDTLAVLHFPTRWNVGICPHHWYAGCLMRLYSPSELTTCSYLIFSCDTPERSTVSIHYDTCVRRRILVRLPLLLLRCRE